MRALILANGEPPSSDFAQQLAAEHDLLLATDGAAHRAVGLGLSPQIVCGDFDSVRLDVAQAEFPHAEFIATPDQHLADLEKAVLLAQERGATQITVIGATGGRIDHTLTSFALLLKYPFHAPVPLRLRDEQTEVVGVVGGIEAVECVLPTRPGSLVSLLSFDGAAQVSIAGVKWPLDAYRLPLGTQGVSNVAEGDSVTVRVQGGGALVCRLSKETA